jgi:hypothetical protein
MVNAVQENNIWKIINKLCEEKSKLTFVKAGGIHKYEY